MKKHVYKLTALCLAVILLMAGCGSNPSSSGSSSQDSDTLTVVISADPTILDPSHITGSAMGQVVRQMYDTLFIYDEDYNITPWLAESYEYEDDETLILHIRQGVKFASGEELKASDVLFTIKNAQAGTGASDSFQKVLVDQSEVLDDYTLKLVTDGPVATLIAGLQLPDTGILSEKAFEECGGDYLKLAETGGSGPYKLVSYSPGDRIEMTANENYWREGEPYYKNLVMRFVTDASSRAIEAETGNADIVYNISSKDIDTVKAAEDINFVSTNGAQTVFLMSNTSLAPMDNILVRQAVWYALDVNAGVQLAYGNFGSVAEDWVCPGVKGADPTRAERYFPTRDVEKAKQLLAEAGYPDGIDIELSVFSSNQERKDLGEVFQSQLGEAGIRVKLNVMELNAWSDYVYSGQSHLTFYATTAMCFEADKCLTQLMPTSAYYKVTDFTPPEFVDAVNNSLAALDEEERIGYYSQAIDLLLENYVTLPCWHNELNATVKDGIEGFTLNRSYEHHLLQFVHPAAQQ